MTDNNVIKIHITPESLEDFQGTQEELDEMIAQIKEYIEGEEFAEVVFEELGLEEFTTEVVFSSKAKKKLN